MEHRDGNPVADVGSNENVEILVFEGLAQGLEDVRLRVDGRFLNADVFFFIDSEDGHQQADKADGRENNEGHPDGHDPAEGGREGSPDVRRCIT